MSRQARKRTFRVAVIGAGLAGLSAAYHLERLPGRGSRKNSFECAIFERESRPGGLCRTERAGEFLFDYAGHFIHAQSAQFRRLVGSLLAENLATHTRRSWVWFRKRLVPYPFQANLRGVPADVAEECLYEASRAYFRGEKRRPTNFAEWAEATFGRGIARHFMLPYNRKLWRIPLSRTVPDSLGRFVPEPDLRRIIRGAIAPMANGPGYNSRFRYPRRGGIESFPRALAGKVKARVHTGSQVRGIDLSSGHLVLGDGGQASFDFLVSTMPLKDLVPKIVGAPADVLAAAGRLRHVSVMVVNLGFEGPSTAPGRHWQYVPEAQYLPYRVGFPSNLAAGLAPAGCGSVSAEVSHLPGHRMRPEHCVDRVIADLTDMRILESRRQVKEVQVLHIPYAFVIHDREREGALKTIQSFLSRKGVLSIGRFGAWEYSAMEEAVMAGRMAAEAIAARVAPS